ncbi:MAG: hypothetical protein ABSD21_03380 [Rhizomicrobium sp.]|jgi:hypothetical protein
MSKLGVGVGEEFPVDEEKKREEAAAPRGEQSDPGCCGPGSHFGGTHDDHREAWRRWRNQMRAEWKARRHAMHEHFHDGQHADGESEASDRCRPRPHHLLIGALAVIGLAALLSRHHHNSD